MTGPARQPAKNGRAPHRVAALHRQGDAWRLLIAEALNGGSPGLRVLDASTISFGDTTAVRAALAHHRVDRLIRLLPASSVVCRVVPAPDAGPADTLEALHLLAEASLPVGLPAHRRAASIIDADTAESRAVLVVGWPGEPPEPRIGGVDESWAPEPAALLWLLRRRCRAALYADRDTESISILARGPQRTSVRALRESALDNRTWRGAVESRFAETITAAGISPNGSPRALIYERATLLLEGGSALTEGIAGAHDNPEWLAHYLVSLAAVAAHAPSLSADPPGRSESLMLRLARRLAAPRTAAAVVITSLVLALLGPLALAGARLALFNAQSGGLQHQQAQERSRALAAAFHQQLERRRWPMTRLLADLAAALPVGVTIESLRLEAGERVSLHGRAGSLELVNRLQTNLNSSGVFTDASIDRTQDAADSRGVDFDASITVARPHAAMKRLDEFASRSLAQRLDGNRASALSIPDREGEVSSSTSANSARSGDASSPRERSTRPDPAPFPFPISDDEIARLDAKAAMKQWTDRQKAAKQPGLDAALRGRLTQEAEKCRQRMLAARKEAAP
jgi:Tfp pilus assembly protein PilN